MTDKDFNKKWNTRKIIEETIRTFPSHLQPTPETKERLLILEINQENLMNELKQLNIENKDQHKGIMDIVIRLEEKLDKALEKKANKWVEKAITGFVVLVLSGMASYIGMIIYKSIIYLN